MKRSIEKILKVLFIIIVITAMAAPQAVLAQDVAPTEAPVDSTEVVVLEEPVVDETTAPTEVVTEAPVVEGTDAPAEAATEAAVETAAPTEEPVVEEDLSEVVDLLTTVEITIVDENGDPLSLASQEAANVISNSDPFFWNGSQWVGYTSLTGTCPSFVAVCNQVASPFTSALSFVPENSTLYVASGYYDEEVTVSTPGLSFTAFNTISGIAGDPTAPTYTQGFASIRALILNAAFNQTLGVYADAITVTPNGYLSDALNLANPINTEATITADVIGTSSSGILRTIQDAYHSNDTKFEWECGEPSEDIISGKIYTVVLKNPKSADVINYYKSDINESTSQVTDRMNDLLMAASIAEKNSKWSDQDEEMVYWYLLGQKRYNQLTNSQKQLANGITGAIFDPAILTQSLWFLMPLGVDPVAPTKCQAGFKLTNGRCIEVPSCPVGSYEHDGQCYSKIKKANWFFFYYCDSGWHQDGDTCYGGGTTAPVCSDGVCDIAAPTCSSNKIKSPTTGLCVTPKTVDNTQLTFLKLPIPQTGCADPALCPMPNPAFTIAKTVVDPQSSYTVGEIIHYSIVVTNTGNVDLPSLTITDPGVTFDVAGCGDAATLLISGTRTCAVSREVTSSAVAGTYTNTATATSGDLSHSSSVDVTIVTNPDFSIEKTITSTGPYVLNDVIEYEIKVTNIGNIPLTNVTIEDQAAPFVAGTCDASATLPVGATKMCNTSHTVTQADVDNGYFENTATGDSAETDPKDSTVGTEFARTGGLSIDKVVTSVEPYYVVGSTITYTIEVTNTGNITLEDVVITDNNADIGTCVPANPVASLAPNSTITCSASHVVSELDISAGLTYVNTATVEGDFGGKPYTDESTVSTDLHILGCMDPAATNFNTSATIADGSCTYPVVPVTGATPALAIPVTGGALIPVTGGTLIVSGLGHSCMTYNNGQVVCWGLNASGQLGDGSQVDKKEAVYVKDLTGVMNLTAGSKHTCALTASGDIWCWGENSSGQLGNGSTTNSNVPVQVSGLPDKVLSITAGEEFTCVQLMNQEVWCWGKNNLGQLNDGTTKNQPSPVKSKLSSMMAQISGGQGLLLGSDVLGSVNEWVKAQAAAVKELENTLSISANRWGETGCAVSADGSVKCWGSDLLSIPVTGAASAMEVGTGLDHNCTINSDQTVSCWGSNGSGQLGDGTNKDSDSAKLVKNMSLAKVLAVGAHHTCVLSGTGNTAMCWGENTFGQLGNGSNSHSNVPVLVVLP